MIERVACFIDGFNLYHSLDDLKKPHLKWVDLWALAEVFISRNSQRLDTVYYFSAFADWMPDKQRRHQAYVDALIARGITPIIAAFKNKSRYCPSCKSKWTGHEEKETDVNIAVTMLSGAYRNEYDHAFLVSRDSDITPAIRILRADFPKKEITVIAPPNRGHSNELLQIVPPPKKAKIRLAHIERCLLAEVVFDAGGNVAGRRPREYAPPK
jgi:uncharacterized LabA/DUF88 family protein